MTNANANVTAAQSIHDAPSGAPSGQVRPFTGNAMDELLCQNTRASILAMTEAVLGNLRTSRFPNIVTQQALLHSAAALSDMCTKHNMDALTLSEAILICRHNIATSIRPSADERMQDRYVALLALSDALDSKAYKDLIYRQSELLQAHLCLPLEAMLLLATIKLTGIDVSFGVIYSQYAELHTARMGNLQKQIDWTKELGNG
jgi:hypothetical protein